MNLNHVLKKVGLGYPKSGFLRALLDQQVPQHDVIEQPTDCTCCDFGHLIHTLAPDFFQGGVKFVDPIFNGQFFSKKKKI
jgi:hypothetical protein